VAVGELITVEVTGLAPGGDAVGRQRGGEADGRVVFVPLGAPGDRLRARTVREKARVAWAELVSVERASELRVEPPCPLFGRCGGCQWQHVTRAAQLHAKGAIVSRALGLELGPARAVGPGYGYRERARLVVGPRAAHGTTLGFHARRSSEVVDVPACPLLAPALAEALPLGRALAHGAPAGGEVSLQGGRGGVALEVAGRSYRVAGGPGLPASAEPIDGADPQGWPDVSEPGGRPLRVPAGAFAQVSATANQALVEAVREAVGPQPGRVLELYAGSGNFTRHLVSVATSVIASDGDAQAVRRGRLNVPEADWRSSLGAGGPGPVDTVVVDPPRDGLDRQALALASAARVRLVYVSCDPQTLGRDVARLAAAGLRLEGAVALDLMPQTHHVEVVATLVR
jgi:23S rRNA (uracil1939-C5)-methyltransferase